jgi:hypothetical protein
MNASAIRHLEVASPSLGEGEVRKLLLLMDSDKNGKISKQEWMDVTAAEFDRLDKRKSGGLDANQLAQSSLRVSRFAGAGGNAAFGDHGNGGASSSLQLRAESREQEIALPCPHIWTSRIGDNHWKRPL